MWFCEFGININNFNMKGGKSIYKYNKVTQQKKFHLLTLVLHQKLLIKQAARIVGINYSTAKTIMFFNRNLNKSYQFSFQNPQHSTEEHQTLRASYKELASSIAQPSDPALLPPRIAIFNSTGSQRLACRSIIHGRSSSGNFSKRMRCDSNEQSEDFIDDQKNLEDARIQRPRTRSQSALYRSVCKYKPEEHQKRDFESSNLPEIAES